MFVLRLRKTRPATADVFRSRVRLPDLQRASNLNLRC
jgi:hypothetical protein